MIVIKKDNYDLILSHDSSDLFRHYNVEEMHGLSLKESMNHPNTKDSAYICGLCNYVPKDDGMYEVGDRMFVFINLTRCNNPIETFGHIMHEMMHLSFELHDYDIYKEEEMITWAEKESHEVYKYIEK